VNLNGNLLVIYIIAFAAVVVLVQTLSDLFLSARSQTQKVNQRLALLESGMNREEVFAALVRRHEMPVAIRDVSLVRAWEALEIYCRQAGLTMSPLQLLSLTAGAAGILWVIGLAIGGFIGIASLTNGVISLVGAVILAIAGVSFWISRKHEKRIKTIEEQLPQALDVIVRAVRAGHPVVSALQLAAQEMGDPLGTEFGLVSDETTYGAEFKDALTNFARRTGSSDASYFAVCIGIQTETGGNLAEILDNLAGLMRSRGSLAKRVRSLSSEGRASAAILSILPLGMIGFIMMTRPTIYTAKFSDPIFWPSVAGVFCLYMLGLFFINRIINIKY
jgi:tight adherence protein B